MPRSFYSVTFRHIDGSINFSRTFATKRAALNWRTWLTSQAYVAESFAYRGQPKDCVLQMNPPCPIDVSHETAYGRTTPLSFAIRVF